MSLTVVGTMKNATKLNTLLVLLCSTKTAFQSILEACALVLGSASSAGHFLWHLNCLLLNFLTTLQKCFYIIVLATWTYFEMTLTLVIRTKMIALLGVTKNNYDLDDYCGSTSHCWSSSCHGINGLFGIIRRSFLFLLF